MITGTDTIHEIMAREVYYAEVDAPVCKVADLMLTRNVGAIPIVDSNVSMKIVGIVTDRDLAIRVVARKLDPITTPVSAVMTGDVVHCGPFGMPEDILIRIKENRIRRIPVVDREERLIGIVSVSDLQEYFRFDDSLMIHRDTGERKEYEGQLESKLSEVGRQIDELMDRLGSAADAGSEAVESSELVQTVSRKRQDFESRFEELKASGDEAWSELQKGVDQSWHDLTWAWTSLKDACQNAAAKFR